LIVNLYENSVPSSKRQENNNIPTITKISDDLWDNINDLIPKEKPRYTACHPVIPHLEKSQMVFYMFLEPDVNGKGSQKNIILVLHVIVDQ
jgi:hypothetical protein